MVLLKRIGFYVSGAVSVLLALAFLGLGWLLFTESGARWSLQRLLPLAPVSIQYYDLTGTLWRGLRLRQLTVSASDDALGFERITAAEVAYRWQPLALMSGRLVFERLALRDVEVLLSEAPAGADSPPALPAFSMPMHVDLRRLHTQAVRLVRAGETQELPDLQLRLVAQGEDVLISRLRFQWESVDYALSARAQFAEILTLRAEVTSHGINADAQCRSAAPWDCSANLRWVEFSHPLTGEFLSPSGELALTLRGDTLDVVGEADLAWPLAATPIDTRLRLAAAVDFASSAMTVSRLEGGFAGGQVQASGQLRWAQDFDLEARVATQGLSLAQWLPPALSESKAQLTSQLTLHSGAQGVNLLWAIDQMQLNFGARPIAGRATFNLQPTGMGLSDVSLTSAGGSLTGDFYYGDDEALTMAAVLDATDLASIVPELSGRLKVAVDADGTLSAPSVRLKAEGAGLAVAQWQAASLHMEAQVRAQAPDTADWVARAKGIQLDGLDLKAQGLAYAGDPLGEVNISASGNARAHKIAVTGHWQPDAVTLEQLALSGAMDLPADAADGAALLAALQWRPKLEALVIHDPWLAEPWRLAAPARGQVGESSLTWQALCLKRAKAKVCWDALELQNWQALTARGRVAGVYLDRARSFAPELHDSLPPGWELRGEATADWQLALSVPPGAPMSLNMDASLALKGAGLRLLEGDETALDLPVEAFRLRIAGSEKLLEAKGNATLAENQQLQLSAQASDWLTAERAGNGRLVGNLQQLTYLQPFLPSVQELAGRAEVDLSFSLAAGAKEPLYDGRMVLADVGMLVPSAGTRLQDWRLLVEAAKGDLLVSGGGLLGGGAATINGDIKADHGGAGPVFNARLHITGDDLGLIELPDVRLRASPDLTLVGNGRRWHLAGDVLVENSSVVLRELPEAAAEVSEDARVYGDEAETTPRRSLLLFTSDVGLQLGEAVRFEGFGLTTSVDGSLRFTRDENRTNQMQGVLGLPEGRFRSYGQKLDIKNGRIIFSGPVDNPVLDVRAARKVEDVEAGIWLTGTAKFPKTELYSTPSMSEADILAYIVSGKPISQSGQGDVVDMQAAALSLGLKQALPLLQRIGGQFGLSDISIEEASNGDSSIAAGKRLSDRLYVKYVYGLLGSAGNFILQYKLSDQLTLETSSGTTQAIDITYNWASTPPTPAESSAELKATDD